MSKVWFITGTSRGLGRAIAHAALASGASVIATARDVSSLEPLTNEFPESRLLPLPLDVSVEKDVIAAVKKGHERFGRIDVVVNNAGYAEVASVEDFDMTRFRAQMDANFMGTVYVSKACVPILRQQGGGHIFQVSSLGGRLGVPGLTAYQSSKWAIGGFSTGLSLEVAPLGIKVTVLEPGGIRTDWAGSSMTIARVSEPYQQTVGATAERLQKGLGKEPSLPHKIAKIIIDLSEKEDVPLRLLIGPDAAQYGDRLSHALAESDRKWHDLTMSSA